MSILNTKYIQPTTKIIMIIMFTQMKKNGRKNSRNTDLKHIFLKKIQKK